MAERDGNRGIRLLTVSLAGLLLSVGLCGVGEHFEGRAGTVLATAGAYLFVASLIGIAVGMLLFLFGKG